MNRDMPEANSQIGIRKARHDDLDALIKVLGRAYDQEPFLDWLAVQDQKRTQRIERFFEISLRDYPSTMKYDHVFTTEQLNACAIWYPPEPRDSWKAPLLRSLILMPKFISIHGIRKLPSVWRGLEIANKHHLKEPHYYLFVVGVDPVYQGKGIGSLLIRHGLQRCNERGMPAYLETAEEELVGYYEKHAFKVTQEFLIPRAGPTVWCMIYEPK